MKRFVFLATALLLGACGGDAQEPGSVPAKATTAKIEMTGFDFGYELASETVRTGRLYMELKNVGEQPHQALLYRLNDGVSISSFVKEVMRDDRKLPDLATAEGGMTRYAGKGESIVTDGPVLDPGNYAIVCFVRDQSLRTNKNHAELGMIAGLEVTD